MGVGAALGAPVGSAPSRHVALLERVIPQPLRSATAFRRFALWAVITNVGIVVTGGAVRLTNSGLGCPTWPRCTDATLTPTRAYSFHGVIEFTNRQLTFVVALFAVAVWLIALSRRQERTLATLLVLSIPAQAVLGGITVLTHLNPWAVGAHFLFSAGIILVAFWLWWRVRSSPAAEPVPAAALQLARLATAVTAAVLALGTVVTGAGPHAGDTDSSGRVHRNGLKVASMAQLHADSVMVLVGVTVGLVAVLYAVRASDGLRQAAWLLLGIELGQGIIGYTQYFLHVPPLLVGLHMLGACLVWLAALHVLARVEPRAAAPRPAALLTATA